MNAEIPFRNELRTQARRRDLDKPGHPAQPKLALHSWELLQSGFASPSSSVTRTGPSPSAGQLGNGCGYKIKARTSEVDAKAQPRVCEMTPLTRLPQNSCMRAPPGGSSVAPSVFLFCLFVCLFVFSPLQPLFDSTCSRASKAQTAAGNPTSWLHCRPPCSLYAS